MIIDAHAHSGDFLGRSWNAERLLRLMDTYHCDKACISSESAIAYGDRNGNDCLRRDFLEKYPDRFIGFCAINPNYQPVRELRHCIELGFKGIKLHPWYHKCPLTSEDYRQVLELANEKRIPLLVHSGGTLKIPDLSYALPEMFCTIADKYRELPIIIGHMGLERWRYTLELVQEHENIYLDITMSMPNPDRLRLARERVGSKRIVFGTDMPLLDPAVNLGLVYGSCLASSEIRDILGRNVLRIFEESDI